MVDPALQVGMYVISRSRHFVAMAIILQGLGITKPLHFLQEAEFHDGPVPWVHAAVEEQAGPISEEAMDLVTIERRTAESFDGHARQPRSKAACAR